MPGNKIAQKVLDLYLGIKPDSLFRKVLERILKYLRDFIARYSDSEVTYVYAGKKIIIPLSHNLPVSKKNFPQYGDNLQRLANILKGKYNDLCMIDIGANVGDTAVLVNEKENIPVLCVEGDKTFSRLLDINTRSIKNVAREESFVGDDKITNGSFVSTRGTGRIIEDNSANKIIFKPLKDIIKQHPLFAKSKLLKIDTDGFDCRIIKSELPFISEVRPTIFFEYDPFYLKKLNDDGLSVFLELIKIGYTHFLFYDNSGDFILSSDSDHLNIVHDLHYYYTGRNGEKYLDICAFHAEDAEVAQIVHEKEIQFFKLYRNNTN